MASNESRSESHRTPVERSQNSSWECNLNDLEQFAKEEWSKIPVERYKKYNMSFIYSSSLIFYIKNANVTRAGKMSQNVHGLILSYRQKK